VKEVLRIFTSVLLIDAETKTITQATTAKDLKALASDTCIWVQPAEYDHADDY